MPNQVHCPGCGARLRAPDEAAGKRAKCPKCGGSITVPMPEPVATLPPAVLPSLPVEVPIVPKTDDAQVWAWERHPRVFAVMQATQGAVVPDRVWKRVFRDVVQIPRDLMELMERYLVLDRMKAGLGVDPAVEIRRDIAVELLGIVLSDSDRTASDYRRAADALKDNGEVQALVKALCSGDRSASSVADALAELGPRAVASLLAAVEVMVPSAFDAYNFAFHEMVRLLGNIQDRRAIVPLADIYRRALGSQSQHAPFARHAVAVALDALGWEPADPYDRALYVIALRKYPATMVGKPVAVEPLVDALMTGDLSSEVAEALDTLGWHASDLDQQAAYLAALEKWEEAAALGLAAVKHLRRVRFSTAAEKTVIELLDKAGDASHIGSLVDICKNACHSTEDNWKHVRSAVDALLRLLQRNLHEASLQDLEVLVSLNDAPCYTFCPGFGDTSPSWERSCVDCSPIRQIAAEELQKRRGR